MQPPSESPELLDVDVILRDDSPAVDEQLEEADIDGESAPFRRRAKHIGKNLNCRPGFNAFL